MAITTYSELQTAIADFLNRSDLTSTVPTFIALAEAQFQRDVRHWRQDKRSTTTCDGRYTELPDDFVSPHRLYLTGANDALEKMSANEMQDRRYNSEDAAGEPRFYTFAGGEIEVYPTPDDSYTLEMTYRGSIPALSDAATTNWLLTNAVDVYLYGSLIHSAPYLVNDQRVAVWQTLYSAAVNALNEQSNDAMAGSKLRLRVKQ